MVTTEHATTTIFYPETDGMPLPDGHYQDPIFRRVVTTLEVHFRDVPGVVVSGNTFIYYVEGNANRRVSPDCYVAFGLSDAALESLSVREYNAYMLWEVEKPPEFVLEIGSPSTADRDLGFKRDLYADLGIGEYWRFDGSGSDFYPEPLVGERLVNGAYERLEMRREADGSVWAHSDALNLDLWWIDGELRYWDPAQAMWLRDLEESEEALKESEEALKESEEALRAAEARADAAEARAESEAARRAQLEAELRRLRGG